MWHLLSERSPLAGAKPADTSAGPSSGCTAVPGTEGPRPEPTIEDRLKSKAAAADIDDFAGQRSLGQLSRDERRKFLFGE